MPNIGFGNNRIYKLTRQLFSGRDKAPTVGLHFMTHTLYLILFILFSLPNGISAQGFFKNQAEQEVFWTKQLFNECYKNQDYEKFSGKLLVLNNHTIKFDDLVLNVYSIDTNILTLIKTRIFYPCMETNTKTVELLSAKQLFDSKMGEIEQPILIKAKDDTLTITNFEELKYFDISPHIKRFKFWLRQAGFANPVTYFIELTNSKAENNTNTSDFIRGARVTFYKKAWVVI